MRTPLFVQLYSLLLIAVGLWYFYHLPYLVKKDVVSPVPLSNWVLRVRDDDDDEEGLGRYGSGPIPTRVDD